MPSGREHEEAQSVGHSLRLLGEQPLAPTLFRRFANLGRFVAPYAVAVYETATARGATVIIPPARTANVSGHGPRSPARDRTITLVKQLGQNFAFSFLQMQAAARTGRLDVHFSEQSVFGRPRKVASRAAAERFIRTHYRRFAGQAPCPAPLPSVPPDYDVRLKILRSEFELSQPALARLIGAAGKAVVYQWESRKRTPSPVFWQRIQELSRNV